MWCSVVRVVCCRVVKGSYDDRVYGAEKNKGAHSYSKGSATKGSEEAAKFKK